MTSQVNADGHEYFALRTFRQDGSSVSTPVWLASAGGNLYAYTPGRSWKVKRIRRNPKVEVAPSNFAGEPHDRWRPGQARVLPASELRIAKRAMTAKYGNKFRWFTLVTLAGRLRKHGGRAVGLEISLESV
ncbi:PPOX class F420-dependent oxidoreductase [Micromonospora saelicesensis]|uniref:PPOX class F420-dependent oxidoreductase n=1 Tax=Micromonospora saelicesensis TaxID=285676 RepID=UPI000DD93EDA|nr:PPOX class F420-dependent oxidoreductase [Micromonospora saelicesensis]